MANRARKTDADRPTFENCDTFFGIFFWWLLDRTPEERGAILREGITVRRLVEEIAPRKIVMAKLRGRAGKTASPGAYPYAVTASLRARDYFVLADAAAKEAVQASGSDTFVYRRPEILDTVLVPNPDSEDARRRGFPYGLLHAEPGGSAEEEPAPAKRRRRSPAKAIEREEPPPREAEESLEEEAPEGVEAEEELEGSPSEGEPAEWSVPPAFQSAAPGWQRRTPRRVESGPAESDWGWKSRGAPAAPGRETSVTPGPAGPGRQTELRERRPFASPEASRPQRRPAASLVIPAPPLPKRSPEELRADYLASSAGPPLVNVERTPDGGVRYRGWTADLGAEIAPGKRSLDLRQERDFTTFLFLVAALSLDGGYATSLRHLRALFETNLVSASFWRDEGTLLKVGAPRRLAIPQPLQIAFHVVARNEPLIRDVLGFEEIVAGRRPALDVERVYRTLMAERMELPRYWTGPFKRNRRHRRLLPSRLGRVFVARIPTLLRELHCQGVAEVDPAECCAADRIVRRAMYAAGIPVKKPINRMAPLRDNSRAIFERFGELFEMPLLLYGRTWRRR